MHKFIVLINQSYESAETQEEAIALAKTLAEKSPGTSYDVFEHVEQLFADEPVKASVIAKTMTERGAWSEPK